MTVMAFRKCIPVQFHKDGQRTYFITNKGSNVNLIRLAFFNPATGKEELVESDPLNRVDNSNALFSEVTDDLIATLYKDERIRIYWKDKAYEADYQLLQQHLPGKQIDLESRTKDERLWLDSNRRIISAD